MPGTGTGKSGNTISRIAATVQKSTSTVSTLRAAKCARNRSALRKIFSLVFGARIARTEKARPVNSVPVIVEENCRTVLPFSAFILGIDRECQVEDNAFQELTQSSQRAQSPRR